MQAAHHTEKTFLVPRRDDSPDVGIVASPFAESLEDEIAEAASNRLANMVDRTTTLAVLVAFGQEVAVLLIARGDCESQADSMISAAARYERILAWLSEAHDTVQMGLRTFAMLYTLRPDLTGGATLEAIGKQSRRTRAAVDKYIVEFRDTFGVQSPNAKSENTRKKCRKAQLSRRR